MADVVWTGPGWLEDMVISTRCMSIINTSVSTPVNLFLTRC